MGSELMKQYHLDVKIEEDPEGYLLSCPKLQGCFAHGSTLDEAIKNLKEVAELLITDMLEDGEDVPLHEVQDPKNGSGPTDMRMAVAVPA